MVVIIVEHDVIGAVQATEVVIPPVGGAGGVVGETQISVPQVLYMEATGVQPLLDDAPTMHEDDTLIMVEQVVIGAEQGTLGLLVVGGELASTVVPKLEVEVLP